MSKRLSMTLDDSSYNALQQMAANRGVSLAEVIRDSLALNYNVQYQARTGFNELVVRNPKTDEGKVLVIPGVQSFNLND